MGRGHLFVIEGLDRSGKSTQCETLLKKLNSTSGSSAHLFKFPDRTTTIGIMINSFLTSSSVKIDHRAIHLLFSANRWERAAEISALLESGKHVICDRYYFSGIAYSLTQGLDRSWCEGPDIGLPRPDRVFFLNVSEDVAQQRGGFGMERYEKVEIQRAVKKRFLELFQGDDTVTIVDASRSIQDVTDEITNLVEQELNRDPGPIRTFAAS